MTVLAEAPVPVSVTVIVSLPSVFRSLRSSMEICALPKALTTVVPASAPPTTSSALTPLTVKLSTVPAGTLVVSTLKMAVCPSS